MNDWTSIKIDKDIPVPKRREQSRKGFLDALNVGDSFFIERIGEREHLSTYGKMLKKRFATRTTTENGKTGLRIWRIE